MLYSPQPFLGRIVRIDPESGTIAMVAGAVAARLQRGVHLIEPGMRHLRRVPDETDPLEHSKDRISG